MSAVEIFPPGFQVSLDYQVAQKFTTAPKVQSRTSV